MATLSLSRNGADTPVALGKYTATLITSVRDSGGTLVSNRVLNTSVTAPHTLGSLANGLATLFQIPGNVIDLVITPE